MLMTALKHLETEEDLRWALKENENVMICCGRMGPMCIPVYRIMEKIEQQYPHVAFYDMEFDIKAAGFIRNLPECSGFGGLPFTVYFQNGNVVAATASLQRREDVVAILDAQFGASGVKRD
ncbi:MAG: thioredoxin [Spirochaetales bacterium]|nr:thioredoxin [Spirochaetales bacterium]